MSEDPDSPPNAPRIELIRSAVADRMPTTLRGARFGLDVKAVVVVVVAGLLGAAVGVAYLLRSRPVELDPPGEATITRGADPSTEASDAPSGELVVDMEGKVRRPGIVRVPAGSRVMDAVAAAGGALPGTDTSALNLARLLVDGEQIFVGIPPPPGAEPSGGGASSASGGPVDQIDLNTATVQQLEQLPGVGPVLAQRIVDYRAEHGGFGSIDELRQVTGIGDQRFADLKDLVRVGAAGVDPP